MSRFAAICLFFGACTSDYETQTHKRVLSTSQATFDAGLAAVNDRETLRIFLNSTGQGAVTVYDVEVDDPDHWIVSTSWMTGDSNEDGVADSQEIDGGTNTSPSYGLIEVVFAPDSEGQFRTVLTIESDDTEATERTEDDMGIWKVVLRGIGQYPCARIYPEFHDFGYRPPGGYYSTEAIIENCGNVTLTVQDFDLTGSSHFYVATLTPIYVLAADSEAIEIAWSPADYESDEAELEIDLNDPYFDSSVELVGNRCEVSVDDTWDADDDGWFSCAGDCDDNDSSKNPSALEKDGNDKDDDCDDLIDEAPNDEAVDNDGDGYSEDDGDCDDADSDIYPDAEETPNQIDDNCNGEIDEDSNWSDDDGDGLSEREGDCDDSNALVYPGAEEDYNDIDDDCDNQLDENSYVYDDDGDGFTELDEDDDCDDNDPWTYPDADEDCDGRDNDCDDIIDEGEDGEADGACAYLVEHQPIVTESEATCATANAAPPWRWIWVAALVGLLRRRQSQ